MKITKTKNLNIRKKWRRYKNLRYRLFKKFKMLLLPRLELLPKWSMKHTRRKHQRYFQAPLKPRTFRRKISKKFKAFLFSRLLCRLRFSGRKRLLQKFKRMQKRKILRQRIRRLWLTPQSTQRNKRLRKLIKRLWRQKKRKISQRKRKNIKSKVDVTQSFIKGRTYFTEMEPDVLRRKFKVKRPLRRLKRKISRNFEKSLNKIKRKKSYPNYHFNSYFARYLRHRRLLRRTRYNNQELYWRKEGTLSSESGNFYDKMAIIKHYEYKRAKWQGRNFKPRHRYYRLSRRRFAAGQVYITHKRRNVLVTIMEWYEYRGQIFKRIHYKTSCGLIGFKGPKRTTKYARESTIEDAGHILARDEFTTIDINFTRGIGHKFYPYIGKLSPVLIYVKAIRVTKRRSHGFTRLQKAKRK